MKIKGIDLYKKVLGKDESVLNKKFSNGEYVVKVSKLHGTLQGESWYGLLKESGINILNNASPSDIHAIFLSEWEEVKESVDFMTAIKSLNEGSQIYCEVDDKKYTYYKPSTPTYEIKSIEAGGISIAEILYGKWYVND